MSAPITVVSSMATKALLSELACAFEAHAVRKVSVESLGGVDAAKRVEAGEIFDVVVLARDAIDRLLATCRVKASAVDLVHSRVAVAVRTGGPKPKINREYAVKRAVLGARTVGLSTGPSGVKLTETFGRWGITALVRDRIVVAPPGVSVGTLVARGEVELGFQQLSELMHVDGIDVVGPLPASMQIVTTFAAAVGPGSRQPDSAQALIAFMASEATSETKRRHGMEPAEITTFSGGP